MQSRPTDDSGKRDNNEAGTATTKHQHSPSRSHKFDAEQKGQFIINQALYLGDKKAKKNPCRSRDFTIAVGLELLA
jgi:hypothetical protein